MRDWVMKGNISEKTTSKDKVINKEGKRLILLITGYPNNDYTIV